MGDKEARRRVAGSVVGSALDRVERSGNEIRDRANQRVRRLLETPTDEERKLLVPLHPRLAVFLSPLKFTPKSVADVIGRGFFWSDLFAQSFNTLRNVAGNPATSRPEAIDGLNSLVQSKC